ncbi:hypothetical protein BU26DRAFT_501529 [Trematosphaeria pertusa]|uniref:Uncharacterized protein n=1 Tax=Trematosphaeria pertusa TaxID=390896 RepID=A0A6A6IUP8_9PLEO|nr:uncharacterized protein BU26DRAFT_501529 [Trematosphaeria pertusa]KAF2253330.1 hypothetical protein BU26DRAFT_501529 [Trematosphaeria pertusa]
MEVAFMDSSSSGFPAHCSRPASLKTKELELMQVRAMPSLQSKLEACDYDKLTLVEEQNATAKLFRIADWLDRSQVVNQLAKRTICLTLAELHPKGSNVNDLLLRFQAGSKFHHEEEQRVTRKLYEFLRVGSKWKTIIQLCARRGNSWKESSTYSGAIWLLSNGSTWERATENECERAISTFEEDFLTECKNYSPSVNAVLKHLNYDRRISYGAVETNASDDTDRAKKRAKIATNDRPEAATAESTTTTIEGASEAEGTDDNPGSSREEDQERRILGKVDANMLYQFPDLGGAKEQQDRPVPSPEGHAGDSAANVIGADTRVSVGLGVIPRSEHGGAEGYTATTNAYSQEPVSDTEATARPTTNSTQGTDTVGSALPEECDGNATAAVGDVASEDEHFTPDPYV